MNNNEKLIEEARKYVSDHDAYADNHLLRDLANALEAAEKAHAPIDDEREAQHAELCGCSLPHCEFLQGWEAAWDAALRSILRRSVVPEPSAGCCDIPGGPERCGDCPIDRPQGEPSDTQVRKVAHTGPGHASGDAGYCEGCLAEREQRAAGLIHGEPSDAQVEAALKASKRFVGRSQHDAMRAALRAAGGVR